MSYVVEAMHKSNSSLLAVPHPGDPLIPHLFLELEDAVKQSFGRGRTTRNIDVNRQDTVDTAKDTIAVVVVSSSVGATAHGKNPFGIWHLVVAQADSRGHLVSDSASDNHNVGLTGRGAKNDS